MSSGESVLAKDFTTSPEVMMDVFSFFAPSPELMDKRQEAVKKVLSGDRSPETMRVFQLIPYGELSLASIEWREDDKALKKQGYDVYRQDFLDFKNEILRELFLDPIKEFFELSSNPIQNRERLLELLEFFNTYEDIKGMDVFSSMDSLCGPFKWRGLNLKNPNYEAFVQEEVSPKEFRRFVSEYRNMGDFAAALKEIPDLPSQYQLTVGAKQSINRAFLDGIVVAPNTVLEEFF